jgi:tetratricopeptide (TPR) repeat protein
VLSIQYSSFIIHYFLVVSLCLIATVSSAGETKPPRLPGPLILDDVPQPLPPRPRTQAQRDHLEAVSLFAAGTMHERREEYAQALRCYQRALRCDPKSPTIARAIVPVAVRLKHYAEAIRYVMKAVELDDADPALLRRLGSYLTEEGDWNKAIILYEKALALRGKGKETAADILLRMEMARLYQLTEKYKQAADSFARVLYAIDHPEEFALDDSLKKILLGEPGQTFQLMGECFLMADRPQEAQAAFEKADKSAPNKALRQYNLARVYAKTGKPAEALAALEAGFVEHLTDQGLAPYETLSEVLGALGKKAELLDRLEKLRTADPKNMALGYYLAAQYRAAGKLDQAESLYVELLKGKATLAGYRALVEIYRQAKRYDALLDILGEALEKTSVLDVLGAEAQTISGNAESMRGIVEAARAKLKSDGDKFGYGRSLAVALLALEAKQYETAGEFFDLALKAKPKQSAEVLMVWGVGLLAGERAAESVKVFQRGIDEKALPNDNPAFYFYLAGALASADRFDEALAAARAAVEKQKDSARMHSRVAWVLYVAKRHAEAEKAYRKLIEDFDADHANTNTREVLRDTRLALSNLAVLKNDMAQAEEWLAQVLDEFPDDVSALNDLGYLWADQNKNLERARGMIEKAVAAEPENMAYRDSLGWVLFRLGQFPQAVTELEKAASATAAKKPDPVVLDHLGDAYQKVNQREKAVKTWRKAAEVFRQEKESEKAQAVEKKTKAN